MRPDPIREGRRWLRQVQRNLDDARYSQAGGRYHLACFLSQQAGEKALKGYLYAQGAGRVWGYSVADLVRKAASCDPVFEALVRIGGTLDRHYIPTRYPNGLPGGIPTEAFDADDAEKPLRQAERVIRQVAEALQRLEG
ncbi:MAG TPA: HEPN domain-containing protein [Anaerolineales bacterium]|nr:HEPN domain-containing protein [Anaerolineae bacterium]HIQ01080.1 HEPN domain-containing protein [Anaerolineales bacterium]